MTLEHADLGEHLHARELQIDARNAAEHRFGSFVTTLRKLTQRKFAGPEPRAAEPNIARPISGRP